MEMEHMSLITELTQGKELALQLRTHLQPSSSSPPAEPCFFLTEMIQSSFEKALLLLNWSSSNSVMPDPTTHRTAVVEEEESRKNKRKSSRDVLKKRKLQPRWTEEVKICSGTAPEGPLNDGYNWRKYGQKDIHGANFPRCYYRCSHRHVRGCLATKQVQRSDNDPNIFEVTYRGRHTCSNQSTHLGSVSVSAQNEISEETHQNQRNPKSEVWFNFGEQHFGVKSEDFDQVFPPISFLSSPVGSENNMFFEPMMDLPFIADGGFSTAPVSPAASETAWDWSAYDGGEIQRVQSSEQSEMTEIISATTSETNSPIRDGDWDFLLDKVDFDQNFPFDCLDFLSS